MLSFRRWILNRCRLRHNRDQGTGGCGGGGGGGERGGEKGVKDGRRNSRWKRRREQEKERGRIYSIRDIYYTVIAVRRLWSHTSRGIELRPVHCVDHNGRIITATEHRSSLSLSPSRPFLATHYPPFYVLSNPSPPDFSLSRRCNPPLHTCGPYVDYNSLLARAINGIPGKKGGNPRNRHRSRSWKRAEKASGIEPRGREKYLRRRTRYYQPWNNDRFSRVEDQPDKSGIRHFISPALWWKLARQCD